MTPCLPDTKIPARRNPKLMYAMHAITQHSHSHSHSISPSHSHSHYPYPYPYLQNKTTTREPPRNMTNDLRHDRPKRKTSKGNPCTGAAPPPTVSSPVSPPIACSLVMCVCLLAGSLCFFVLRSGQTIARASIETLPHKRVAAAYMHWLIAANGIASSQRDALGYGCCSCCWL